MTVFDGMISRNFLRTGFLPRMLRDARLVLFCPQRKLEYYRREFGGDALIVEAFPAPTHPRGENFFWTFSFYSIPTRSAKILLQRFFEATGRKKRITYGVRLMLHWLGTIRPWRRIIRAVYRTLPDRSFDAFFEKYHPALVFAPNMVSHEDTRILKTAQRRGVATIGMMKSWDNVNTKAFIAVHPDFFLAQNAIIRDDLVRIADYPAERIAVTGFPQFDSYADRSRLTPREDFFRSLGLDPKKKTILYAAAGDTIAPKDPEVLRALCDMIERGELGRDVQILLRPHPKYVCHEEEFADKPYLIVDRPGMHVESGVLGTWELEERDIRHFMDSMTYADVLINSASTTCIEAAIFDTPTVSIAFDGASEVPPALSIRRFYEFECVETLMSFGGVSIAHSLDDLKRLLLLHLSDRPFGREGRRRVLDAECGTTDGKSAERVAEALLEKIKM